MESAILKLINLFINQERIDWKWEQWKDTNIWGNMKSYSTTNRRESSRYEEK